LDSINYKVGLNYPLISLYNHYLFVSSTDGFNTINILKANQNRLSPSLKSNLFLNLSSNLCNSLALSADSNLAYLACQNDGLFIWDLINNVTINTIIGQTTDVEASKQVPIIFLAQEAHLLAINFENPQNYSIINNLSIEGELIIKLAIQEDFLVIASSTSLNNFYIVEISSDYQNFVIVANVTIISGIPTSIVLSENDNIVFVNCANNGSIFIIDISDKKNPILQTILNTFQDIRKMIFYNNITNNFLILSSFLEGEIIIIDVSNPENPISLSTLYVGKSAGGLVLLENNNYLIVQSDQRLTVVEIRDPEQPTIVNQMNYNSIVFCNKMVVSSEIIYLPYFQSFSLYSDPVSLYPYLTVNELNGRKMFTLELINVDPLTLDNNFEGVSLLKTNLYDLEVPGLTFDSINKIITINPFSSEDLKSIRSLEIIFSTKIQYEEFFGLSNTNNLDDLIDELLLRGYIDANMFVTENYDPNVNLQLPANFNDSSAISKVLSKHYMTNVITLTLNDFLDLNSPPFLSKNTLQNQFNQITGVKINKLMFFQLDSSTFIDLDGDILTYSVISLPHWSTFNPYTLSFTGIPTKYDLGSYMITVFCSDGYVQVNDTFNIVIDDVSPIALKIDNQILILGQSFNFIISAGTFYDSDSDNSLSYSACLIINNTNQRLPIWLFFDENNLVFQGTPTSSDISFNQSSNSYYQEFLISVTATDLADNQAFSIFKLTVKNDPPQININKTLQSQLNGNNPEVNDQFIFKLLSDTFIDPNNGTLIYKAGLLVEEITILPDWIQFDVENLIFYIQAPETELWNRYTIVVIASNSILTASDKFIIEVNISWIYILEIISKIAGPLISLIAFIQFRAEIFSLCCKKKYKYPIDEKVFVQENFEKYIYLVDADIKYGKFFFYHLKKNKKKNFKMSWKKLLLSEDISEMLLKIKVDLVIKKKLYEHEIDDECLTEGFRIYQVVECFIVNECLKEDHYTNLVYIKIKSNRCRFIKTIW